MDFLSQEMFVTLNGYTRKLKASLLPYLGPNSLTPILRGIQSLAATLQQPSILRIELMFNKLFQHFQSVKRDHLHFSLHLPLLWH
jgi:hypothetical protein